MAYWFSKLADALDEEIASLPKLGESIRRLRPERAAAQDAMKMMLGILVRALRKVAAS